MLLRFEKAKTFTSNLLFVFCNNIKVNPNYCQTHKYNVVMKNLFLSIILLVVLLSCHSNKGTEISRQEFLKILTTNTIESIDTNDESEFASIRIRGRKENEFLLLRISSYKNFSDSLDILIDSLANHTIYPKIASTSHVGQSVPSNIKYFDNKYWLILLVLPFFLIGFYAVKAKKDK